MRTCYLSGTDLALCLRCYLILKTALGGGYSNLRGDQGTDRLVACPKSHSWQMV